MGLLLRRLSALLRLRCPHCLEGPVFRSLWQMRPSCPVCGITYEREPGYFMNAIFVSYLLGILLIAPLTLWLYRIDAAIAWFFIAPGLALALAAPLLFRYSRLIWMHVDEILDPR
jgi:uncharacterized protein (DUF983 family)